MRERMRLRTSAYDSANTGTITRYSEAPLSSTWPAISSGGMGMPAAPPVRSSRLMTASCTMAVTAMVASAR